MAKIEVPFHIEGEPDFRFALVLESRSVEAHSLIDSGINKDLLKENVRAALENFQDGKILDIMIESWKEKYK